MRFLNIFKYNLLSYIQQIRFFLGMINISNPTSSMYNFWLLLPIKIFLKGRLGTSICFLILLGFLRSQVWSRWDRSFCKSFCETLESCCCVLKICYLFGSQVIWQCHKICIPTFKMREQNFSKTSVVTGQKILISKRGRQVNFWKGSQVIFGENKVLHICSIINK